jgi:ATP-binding cassette subfamily F protein 3
MLELQNLSLQFNGEYLFRDVSVTIHAGDKLALVGANGAGKTSLFRLITGVLQPESGNVAIQKRVKIGYLPQEQILHSGKCLLDEAATGAADVMELRDREAEIMTDLQRLHEDDEQYQELVYQLGSVHHRLEDLDSYKLESRIEQILIGLGFAQGDFGRFTQEFSGGWQMRIALAKILIAEPDIILLDEPTNHLDIDSQQWLASFLKSFRGALILISHDRFFVNTVTTKTLEIFLNKITLFRGNYEAYLKFKEERNAQLEQQALVQEKKIKETQKFIERFRYKATKARQVQSRVRALEKMELIELPDQEQRIGFRFLPPPPSGSTSFELKHITKKYGERTILEDVNLFIQRGEKIAFVGPNGAGKTTLARILAGDLEPTSGDRYVGHNVEIAFYTQNTTDLLEPEDDIIETILPMSEEKSIGQIRALAGAFLFQGDDVFKKVSMLSGGEKSRLALLKTMLAKANVLIFDEPTNHLDFDSKIVLQNAVKNFEGTVIIVSHDIDFLSFPISRVLEIRPGHIKEYPGDIHYYLAKKQEEAENSILTADPGTKGGGQVVNKKEQKRIEAEKRNQKFRSTKDLVKQIEKAEENIQALEALVAETEALLALPETYAKEGLAASLNLKYKGQKEDLAKQFAEWEALQMRLEEIEKQFE